MNRIIPGRFSLKNMEKLKRVGEMCLLANKPANTVSRYEYGGEFLEHKETAGVSTYLIFAIGVHN